MPETSLHTYDAKALAGDYVRAGAGASVCLAPPLLLEVAAAAAYALVAVGTIFAAFGLRTLVRNLTRIELSRTGIRAVGPAPRSIRWDELSAMRLAFYTTRRRRKDDARMDMKPSRDWMELKLRGPRQSISVDSSIGGFEAIVDVAYGAAMGRKLALNDVTRANLDALGFAPGESGPPDDRP